MPVPATHRSRIGRSPWLSVRRQTTILLGVALLLALWQSGAVEPFVLAIPAYGIYFLLHTPLEYLGFVGIEGSPTIFWISAVLWLYVLCATVLAIVERVGTWRES
jgi:hypothetical protein